MLLLCSRRTCCCDLASALGGNSGSENGSENGGDDFFSIVTGPGGDGFEPEKKKKKQPGTHTDRKEGECGRGRDATNRCRSGSQDCGATGGDDLFGRPLSGSSYASVRESELRRHLAHFQQ